MGSQSLLIARVLVLFGLTAGLAEGPATAATVDGGYASVGLARLADLLGQRGWHTWADRSGNLLISWSATSSQAEVARAEAQASNRPAVDTSMLAERLPSFGWTVTRDAGGTLTLVPPVDRELGPSPAQALPRQDQDVGMARLASRLEAGGWTVVREARGGLRFYRQVGAPRSARALDQSAITSLDPVAQPTVSRLAALGEALRHRGWGVDRATDGTLTLRPPAASPGPSAGAADPAPAADTGQQPVVEALAKRGWNLRRDTAGNLFLSPLV